jgi:hypothetical protein
MIIVFGQVMLIKESPLHSPKIYYYLHYRPSFYFIGQFKFFSFIYCIYELGKECVYHLTNCISKLGPVGL